MRVDYHVYTAFSDDSDETKQELKALGVKEFCTFDKIKPIYHSL